MNTLTLTQINAAVDAAFTAALANPPTQRVAPVAIADNATLRTDIYTGPKGSGFVVAAVVDLKYLKLTIAKQNGPETWRNQPLAAEDVILSHCQLAARIDLDNAYDARCGAGLSVALGSGTITFANSASDRSVLDEFRSHEIARLALATDMTARAAILAEPYLLLDNTGTVHTCTVGDAIAAIVAAGELYKALYALHAQRLAAIAAAANIEAVLAIDTTF